MSPCSPQKNSPVTAVSYTHLTDEEKIKLCEIVSASGAEYIKTSTGFSKGGAKFDDVALMRTHCAPSVKVKACLLYTSRCV